MSCRNDISSALVELGKTLLEAEHLDDTYKCLLEGIRRLGFSRATLYFCRQNPETEMLELVRAHHSGPPEERAHMSRLLEGHQRVIDSQESKYFQSICCLTSGKPSLFFLGLGSAPCSESRISGIEYIEEVEAPAGAELLKTATASQKAVCIWLDLPLILGSLPYGKFTVDKNGQEDPSFDEFEVTALCHLRTFAEAAIAKAEVRECDRVIAAAEEAAGRAVAEKRSVLEAVCHTILVETVKLCGVDGGHIRLYSPERHTLVKVAAFQNGGALWPQERKVGSPVAGRVFLSQKAAVFDDAERSKLVQELREELSAASSETMPFFADEKAFACFPLIWGHACEGTLTLTSKVKHVFAGRQNLVQRIANAAAPRIGTWRMIQERTRAEGRSRLVRTVFELLDEMPQSAEDRVRILLVALTSGHGMGYNSCFLLCRNADGEVVHCPAAIGFETRQEAEREWNRFPPTEYVGSLRDDVTAYLEQAREIETRTYPAERIGKSFRLSEASGTLAMAFTGGKTVEPRCVPLREWNGTGPFAPAGSIEANEVYIVPVVFSGCVVGVLYLDNAWTAKTPWADDPEHVKLLKQFCEEVLAPVLVMEEYAPAVVHRCARGALSEATPGIFLADNSGVLRQSDVLFRYIIGADGRGQAVLELDSIKGTLIEADLRQALQGVEVRRSDVPFRSIYGRKLDLDYYACPIRFGDRNLGVVGLVWDSRLASVNAKERLADIVLAQMHSLVRSVRDLRECVHSTDVTSDSRGSPSDAARAKDICEQLATTLEGLRRAGRVAYGLRSIPVDVRETLRTVLAQVKPPMSVKIQVNSPPVVPRVLCDPALLELVLENLASNAFDAIRSIRNPEVTVTIQYPAPSLGEDGLAVLMQDNGPGLPESVRGALRPGGSAADVARQAGLGLAIVRALLDTAGGQLAVLDGAAMQAAGLTVELPIAKTRNQ